MHDIRLSPVYHSGWQRLLDIQLRHYDDTLFSVAAVRAGVVIEQLLSVGHTAFELDDGPLVQTHLRVR
jgi:hypothetical protein